MTDLARLGIADAAKLIASKEVSPVDLTRVCLNRIETYDGLVRSFVTLLADSAMDAARQAERDIVRGHLRGPLHGIPFALKDVFDTAGIRTTAMSRILANNVPTENSAAAERMLAEGAILLGKNATWEFAHGGPSWDVLFPPACNPWNVKYSPAGSSSGSGAAVAADFVPVSLGTDTGGSIRAPAAVCGTVGLKPTYGRVSRRGVIPNSFSQDHVGPLTRTAEDAAIVLQTLAGYDPGDPASACCPVPDYRGQIGDGVQGRVIGIPWNWLEVESPLGAETRAAFDDALALFRDLGAEVQSISLPSLEAYDDVKKTIAISELFTIHAEDLRRNPEMFGANMRYRIIAGGLVRAEDYILALQRRAELARAMQQVMTEVDLLLLPTAEPASLLEPGPPESLFTSTHLTSPFNVSGNPALSVCSGYSRAGLPFSLQIVGRLFDEAAVLRAAHAYQAATRWTERRPVLCAAKGADQAELETVAARGKLSRRVAGPE